MAFHIYTEILTVTCTVNSSTSYTSKILVARINNIQEKKGELEKKKKNETKKKHTKKTETNETSFVFFICSLFFFRLFYIYGYATIYMFIYRERKIRSLAVLHCHSYIVWYTMQHRIHTSIWCMLRIAFGLFAADIVYIFRSQRPNDRPNRML